MRVIVNADDFGYSQDTVAATVEAFARRAITSASLMACMPATDAALAFARAHPEHSFGVHLNFISDHGERPLSRAEEIPSLTTAEGRFRADRAVRTLALLNLLPPAQIAREAAAQLAFFRDQGIALSHVDSHYHTHKFAPFRAALEEVLPRFGIRRVRSVQDVYLRPPWRSPTYWLGGAWRRAIRRRFLTTAHFYMPTTMGDRGWASPLLDRMRGWPDGGALEVGVHPGRDEGWRAEEGAAVLDFAQRARAAGHELIGWNQLGA